MPELPPLRQTIILDASGVPAAVSTTTTGLAAVSAEAEATSAKVKKTTGIMGGMVKGFAAFAALNFVTHELRSMRDETANLQAAQTRLSQALNGIGVTSEKTQQDIYNTADSLYQLGFQGSDAVNAMGTLVTSTGSVSQAQKLLAMSADYARYKHMDLNSAAILLSRATTGNVKALTQMGITLDKTLPKNQAIAKAFDELNKKIGGQAVAYTKTFSGQLDIAREKFDNIAQTIGKMVLPVLTIMVKALGGMAEWLQKNSVAAGIFATGVLVVVGYLKLAALWGAIVAGENPMLVWVAGIIAAGVAFAWLWNHVKIFRETVAESLAQVTSLVGYLVGGIAKLVRMLAIVSGSKWLKGVADEADKVAVSIGKAAKSIDDLKNKKVTAPKIPKLPAFATPGTSTGILGQASGGDATKGGKGQSQNVQYVTVYASNTNDIAKKLSKAAKHGTPIGGTQ